MGVDAFDAARGRVFIETAERPLDGPARGGDHGDAKARELHQLVDHPRRRGIVHGDGQGAADLGDGQHGMAPRVAPVDHAGEPPIDGHLLQVDEGNLELLAQGLPHGLVGDVVELEEDLAEGKLDAFLLGEGMLELRLGDRAFGEENLTQPVARHGRNGQRALQRASGADGRPQPYVCEGHLACRQVTGRSGLPPAPLTGEETGGEPRRPTAASSWWCIPRSSR